MSRATRTDSRRQAPLLHFMRSAGWGLPALIFLALLVLTPGLLPAQATLSTIRGTATDSSGAVIPGMDIVITDKATNVKRTVITDDLGNFEATNLKLGTYRLEATMPGFKTFVADNLILESSQVRRVDIRLELGESTQEVTVNADAAVIEKEEAKISASIGQKHYEATPQVSIEKLNPNVVLLTLPGVQVPRTSGFGVNVTGLSGGNNFTEGMDGAQNDNTFNQVHNMEDVAEMKVVTINNTADFARVGHYNLVSKRGSNDFHGSIFYYHMNSALNARGFFTKTKAPFKQHFFGASGGGPIIKDKTFFYGSYTARRDPSKNWKLATVPTAKMRTGDFSELPDSIQVIDPLTGQPFPNRVIPAERINPVSSAVLERFYPLPNRDGLTSNYDFFHEFPDDLFRVDYITARVDHQLTENNELYVRLSQRWTPYVLTRQLPGTTWTRERYGWQTTVNDTHIFSSTLVNSFRFGWYSSQAKDGDEVSGVQPPLGDEIVRSLGIQGVNPRNLSAVGGPTIGISGYSSVDFAPGGYNEDNDEISYADSLIWTKGAHVWKFGVDVKTNTLRSDRLGSNTFGNFQFSNFATKYAFADFLLGIPLTSSRLDPLQLRVRNSYELGLFFTDTFKVSPDLTLDYGLRWDYFGPASYDDGLMYNWDPVSGEVIVPASALNRVSPLYDPRITVRTGEVEVIPEKKNFAPRLGLAYRINDRTVLRGGYGIFTEYLGQTPFAQGAGPFEIAESYTNALVNGVPLFSWPNAFPNSGAQIPSQSVAGYDREVKNGYIQQFNVSFEREMKDIGLRLSYVGSRSRGLNYSLNINKPEPSLIPFTPDRRPYPQFNSAAVNRTNGAVNYDALMIRALRKAGQFTFDAHWTWAHSMANNLNLQNPYNPNDWNQVALVPRHRAVVSALWAIPVGRGQRYLSDASGILNHVLGNWNVTWLALMQTGEWFSPSFSGSDPSNTNSFGGLPDRVADGNLPRGDRTVDRWFDTSAFVVPPAGRFGNSGVNILEGPGTHVHSLSIAKDFILHEEIKLEFGFAMANIFNHPNFNMPGSNISNLQAGRISSDVGNWNFDNGAGRKGEVRLRIRW